VAQPVKGLIDIGVEQFIAALGRHQQLIRISSHSDLALFSAEKLASIKKISDQGPFSSDPISDSSMKSVTILASR
jgi:hypothetical protein